MNRFENNYINYDLPLKNLYCDLNNFNYEYSYKHPIQERIVIVPIYSREQRLHELFEIFELNARYIRENFNRLSRCNRGTLEYSYLLDKAKQLRNRREVLNVQFNELNNGSIYPIDEPITNGYKFD